MKAFAKLRKNGKWSDIRELSNGKFSVAMGFAGNFKAFKVNDTTDKDLANIMAKNWVTSHD